MGGPSLFADVRCGGCGRCAIWIITQPTNYLLMVGYRILGEDESESLKQSKYSRFRSIMDFKSIFTYSAQSDPLNDKGNSANNMTEYYSVPKDDVEYSKFETAFDYKSIFSYSNGSNKKNGKAKTQDYDASSTDESPPNDNVDVVISNIILMCSYVLNIFLNGNALWCIALVSCTECWVLEIYLSFP